MTHPTPEQPGLPERNRRSTDANSAQPAQPAGSPAPDVRSAAERAADASIVALFQEAGLALSNGHAPSLQGADARARAAEEDAIAAMFRAADSLDSASGPDFRQMAAKAREIARERGPVGEGSAFDEELVGEKTRSDLQQLPDLEVRCWNVSHTASLPVETAVAAAVAPAAAEAAAADMVTVPAAGEPPLLPRRSTRRLPALTAHDAANIRENNWTEFKQRYHRERGARILELSTAGAFGAAACFLLVWATGAFTGAPAAQQQNVAVQTPALLQDNPRSPLLANRNFGRANPDAMLASDPTPAVRNDDPDAPDFVRLDPNSIFGPDQSDWIKKQGKLVGVTPDDILEDFGGPEILIPKNDTDPNPLRKLQGPYQRHARPGDNALPELFADRGVGLRIISLNPRSDGAQAGLGVNDWITRVIKTDGTAIDLSAGSEQNLQAWDAFLKTQHPGDSFDVEFQSGPLIRRTTLSLTPVH